jgi:hypothetical protein
VTPERSGRGLADRIVGVVEEELEEAGIVEEGALRKRRLMPESRVEQRHATATCVSPAFSRATSLN